MRDIKAEKLFHTIVRARCGDMSAIGQLEKETRRILQEYIAKTYVGPGDIDTEDIIPNIIEKILRLIHSYNPGVYSYEKWVALMAVSYISYFSDMKKKGISKNRLNWQWGYKYTDAIRPELRQIGHSDLFDSVFVKEIKSSFYGIISPLDEKYLRAVMLSFQNPPDKSFWAESLGMEKDAFEKDFINGIKELRAMVFEKNENKEFSKLALFLSLTNRKSLYISAEEAAKFCRDEDLEKVLISSFRFGSIRQASEYAGYSESEFRRFMYRAVEMIAEFNMADAAHSEGKTKLDYDDYIKRYYMYLVHGGFGRVDDEIYIMQPEMREYKGLIDLIFLLFTLHVTPPDMVDLLAFGVNNNASDIHVSAGLPPMLRLDGEIYRIDMPPIDKLAVQRMVYSVMDDRHRTLYQQELDVDFSFDIENFARFRVNAFDQIRGPSAAFRSVPARIRTLDEIGEADTIKKILSNNNGLVLVTGPTGSGKSTTLAAMIDYINKKEYANIITIEDPVEYLHRSDRCLINQREVHLNTIGYSRALRAALREDPDIILVGEMRDLETIRLALTAAETGHLVLATLHTNTAPKAINRIIDVFPASEKEIVRLMLSESLRAVITQTLLKKIGGGRVAALEIMIANSAIRSLIREDKVAQMYSTIQISGQSGMKTMDHYLKELVADGTVSFQEAFKRMKDKTRATAPGDAFTDDF